MCVHVCVHAPARDKGSETDRQREREGPELEKERNKSEWGGGVEGQRLPSPGQDHLVKAGLICESIPTGA